MLGEKKNENELYNIVNVCMYEIYSYNSAYNDGSDCSLKG